MKMQNYRKKILILLAAIPFLFSAACSMLPIKGSLTVSFADIAAKTLTPSISLDAAYYTIHGEGPYGSSFDETTSSSPLVMDFLEVGAWTITVDAYNSSDVLIATGSDSVNVVAGQTTTMSIELLPPDGTGSFFVDVYWDHTVVADPTISTELTPSSGTAISVPSTAAGDGHATVSDPDVPTGYYVMSLQLLQDGYVLSGAVEAVKILDGQETSGSYTFDSLNMPTGSVDLDVTTDTQDPLTITISGAVSTLVYGETMSVTADAGDVTDVSYTWYVNGVSQATGASYTTDSSLAPGSYRLDVIGFTSDGSRAGSASHSFTVTEN
jgi:hypothetical protein